MDSLMDKTNTVIEDRIKKVQKLKEEGINLYPAGYTIDLTISDILERYGHMDGDTLEQESKPCKIAGRIMALRDFGKASFIHIKDRTGRVQAYIRKDRVGEEK